MYVNDTLLKGERTVMEGCCTDPRVKENRKDEDEKHYRKRDWGIILITEE